MNVSHLGWSGEQTDGSSVLSELRRELLALIVWEKKIVLGMMKDLFVNPVILL